MAFIILGCFQVMGQVYEIPSNRQLDSIYISDYEDRKEPDKVFHAEPLYIDLIRDLGARKGEKEWNFGMGLTDNLTHDSYSTLLEYEFAPIDRLGLEIETPFTFYAPQKNVSRDSMPGNRMESLKLAAQYTFLVSDKHSLSLALGYIHEFKLSDFRNFGNPWITENAHNPFFVAAKRWGTNFHTLIYTGPFIEVSTQDALKHFRWETNTNIHYMISGTRNFIGLEINKSMEKGDLDITFRPQMRLSIYENFLIGIVAGIPAYRENQRLSSFLRIIWEPGHSHNGR